MKNNFDFLRLIFALFVVIAHSYPLSGLTVAENWLTKLTSGQIEFSNLGLSGFFIISGFLIFQSLERSKTLVDYFWKRVLRLFPALLIVLLLTVILAPFVYEGLVPYLKNRNVYLYVPRNLSLFNLKYNIDGVFENNPFPTAINGSLWTICYEFSLYILLALLFFVKNKKIKIFLIGIAFVGMFVTEVFSINVIGSFGFYGLGSYYFLKLGTFFVGGALLAAIGIDKLNYKTGILVCLFLLILISIYLGFYSNVKYIALTLFIILLGSQSFKPFNQLSKLGDFSYGIYIYSFPIQQTLMYYFKFNTLYLMFWSVLLSFFFGYLSWNIVEKRALAYKNIFANNLLKFNSYK